MKKLKTLLLLPMLFVLSLIAISVTASAGQMYPVWIGNTQVSTSNYNDVLKDGTVQYQPASESDPAVLYLKNAKLEDVYTQGNAEDLSYIFAEENLIIQLTGNNRIGKIGSSKAELATNAYYGIRATDFTNYYDVTLQGSGNLNIYEKYSGILAKNININMTGTLQIEEYGNMDLACCLKAVASYNWDSYIAFPGQVTVNSGMLKLHSYMSQCVFGNIRFNGGALEAYSNGESWGAAPVLYAMDHKPSFASKYKAVIYLGKTAGSAKAISNPSEIEITSSPYVKIIEKSLDKKPIASVTLKPSKYVYDGNFHRPDVIVKDADGNILKDGKDYQLSYPKSCMVVGSYPMNVEGSGKYTGKITKNFRIVPKKVALTQLRGAKRALKVNWKTLNKECSGYQIKYSTESKFAKAKIKTIKKKSIGSVTIKKLVKARKYYVRIRAYKTVAGKRYYGAWSKTLAAKTK